MDGEAMTSGPNSGHSHVSFVLCHGRYVVALKSKIMSVVSTGETFQGGGDHLFDIDHDQ